MATNLNPYLNFLDGKARAAMEFYQSVLGGELSMMTFGQMGSEGPVADQIMHSQLETPAGFTLMGADAPPEFVQITVGSNMSVSLSGGSADADELRGYFAGLSEGGTVGQELTAAPWGDEFGMVTDQFGIQWMVNIAGPENG